MTNTKTQQKYKIIMVGEASVGKTSILRQFTENKFEIDIMSTIGIDFCQKEIILNNKKNEKQAVDLQIWDTAGQERFHSITKSYYRGSDAIILVFSLLDPRSFECIDKWLRNINEECDLKEDHNILTVIVANKCDALQRLQKTTIDQKIDKINDVRKGLGKPKIRLITTSAKTGANVNELFHYVAQELVDRKSVKPKGKKSIFFKNIKKKGCC